VARSDRELTTTADVMLVGARQTAGAVAPTPSSGAGSGIGFEGVTVAYRGVVVLQDFNLAVEPGEIVAIIGPSGSGKTTALRAVAGFVRPTSGGIRIGARNVTGLPPHARDLGMVVQNYALFPHMRVDENIAFGLRARRAPEPLVNERVQECLRMVGMLDYVRRYPRELSGGQQQRVAIARALAIRPSVLLLDEPLSALDAQIRRNMLEELARLHRELPSLTVLYVTHDQTEALTLADRIAIMRAGRLVAYGPSRSLYRHPPNRFTAEFLGRANLLPVRIETVEEGGNRALVRFGGALLAAVPHLELVPGQDCLLCIRPHDLRLRADGPETNTLAGRVQSVVWQGEQHNIAFEIDGLTLRLASAPLQEPPASGDIVRVHFAARSATLIPRDADERA
jgi:2-aminoethylphosphonate transport system ATP-binding protein